jgi:hypothetical protein
LSERVWITYLPLPLRKVKIKETLVLLEDVGGGSEGVEGAKTHPNKLETRPVLAVKESVEEAPTTSLVEPREEEVEEVVERHTNQSKPLSPQPKNTPTPNQKRLPISLGGEPPRDHTV